MKLTDYPLDHIIGSSYSRHRGLFLLATCLLLLCLLTVAVDLLYAYWYDTSFYFSESLLFSTFWLLFLPIVSASGRLVPAGSTWVRLVWMVAGSVATHLLSYPALIWLLSACFFGHTFPYRQTLHFGLTDYFIKALIVYSICHPLLFHYKYRKQAPGKEDEQQAPLLSDFIQVADAGNRKIPLAIHEILYFSANPPYVNIYHPSKKYLHTATLKALEVQLMNRQFVRIHKSYLVNIRCVESYQSRLNGDYDLTLSDHTVLRLSRKYAPAFKTSFNTYHRLTAK